MTYPFSAKIRVEKIMRYVKGLLEAQRSEDVLDAVTKIYDPALDHGPLPEGDSRSYATQIKVGNCVYASHCAFLMQFFQDKGKTIFNSLIDFESSEVSQWLVDPQPSTEEGPDSDTDEVDTENIIDVILKSIFSPPYDLGNGYQNIVEVSNDKAHKKYISAANAISPLFKCLVEGEQDYNEFDLQKMLEIRKTFYKKSKELELLVQFHINVRSFYKKLQTSIFGELHKLCDEKYVPALCFKHFLDNDNTPEYDAIPEQLRVIFSNYFTAMKG